MPDATRTGFSRLFLLEQRAGPEIPPGYQGFWKAGSLTWDQGDVTLVRKPSDTQYDQFDVIGKIIGAPGQPTMDITGLFPLDVRSTFLKLARRGCDNDIQIHIGDCQDPKDFNLGWTKILNIDAARPTSYSTEDLGALDAEDRALVHETLPIVGEDAYEIVRINFSRQADIQLTREALDVVICDSINCGLCGLPSDGVSKIFALETQSAGSPGANAQIVATSDGGLNWVESTIGSLAANQTANRISCVGVYLVAVSDASDSLHYALITDVLRGGVSGAWAQVTTGFVATKGPRAIFSLGSTLTWMVGEGGYIYFTSDPTAGVTTQEVGSLTIGNLNAIHGFDSQNLVTVGDGNIVLYSTNGTSWSAAPGGGPVVGVNLNTVYMRTKLEWWVGAANGRLYYTLNQGLTWREKLFPGAGSGAVRDIIFVTRTVGYLAFDGATGGGKILRTISGGNTWYVAPEGTGVIPSNTRINQLAGSKDDVNVMFGAGLASNGTDGILVKGS